MAKKNMLIDYSDVPQTLNEHPFFGLTLDSEQKAFRDCIWDTEKLIVFCNAKAGTGKTTIATATSDLLVKYGRYKGVVYIAAPTQEQKQGYLAGSLEQKSEPYFEPFYQALNKLGINLMTSLCGDIINQKNGTGYIECMTHTFLRGCNFENKVVIIDEAQNYYGDELKKVLTRIHDNCKVIVIGHSGQIDLYNNPAHSGFNKYLNHFRDDNRCAICNLSKNYRGWISNHADDLE
jgi:phosphate starvation-inducible protein PhoH and related proteins